MGHREDLRARVDDFLSGRAGLAPVAVWAQKHTREVNGGADAEAKELLSMARATIDALVHNRVRDEVEARVHLQNLMRRDIRDDRDFRRPAP